MNDRTILAKVDDLNAVVEKVQSLRNHIIDLVGNSRESRENLANLLCANDPEVHTLLSTVLYADLKVGSIVNTPPKKDVKREKTVISHPKNTLWNHTQLSVPDIENVEPTESTESVKPVVAEKKTKVGGKFSQIAFSTTDIGKMMNPPISGNAVNKKLEDLKLLINGGKKSTNVSWIPSQLAIRGGLVFMCSGRPVKEIHPDGPNKGYSSLFWSKDVLNFLEPNRSKTRSTR